MYQLHSGSLGRTLLDRIALSGQACLPCLVVFRVLGRIGGRDLLLHHRLLPGSGTAPDPADDPACQRSLASATAISVDASVRIGACDLAALDRCCAISRRTGGVVV